MFYSELEGLEPLLLRVRRHPESPDVPAWRHPLD
jgi:hypothetical protein